MQNYLNEIEQWKQIYPDYDERYDIGSLHYVYGVKSYDDLCDFECNMHTMNDFEILYDRETKEYMLSIETVYVWQNDSMINECKYLIRMLDIFTKYMDKNNLDKSIKPTFCNPRIEMKANTIEELYMKFRMYVKGYCAVCEYMED